VTAADESHAVLSNYPLSRDFRQQLEQRLPGRLRFINIAELRQVSLLNLLRELRGLTAASVTVATEDEASIGLRPVLELLAALTGAHRLQSIDAQLQLQVFTRRRAALHGVHLVMESARSAVALLVCGAQLRVLMKQGRSAVAPGKARRVAYLNCNLWFGLKAGGSVGHISGVANALMDAGFELNLFTAGGRLLVDQRARLVPLEPPRMLAFPLETSHYSFGRRCLASIGHHLRDGEVRFIYQRMSVANFTGVALSRRFGVPLVLEYNGSEAWVARNWGRQLRFHHTAALAEDVNIRHAHLIVTVSEVLRDELLGRGVEAERIVVYPNCIDPRAFDPGRFSVEANLQTRRELGFEPGDVIATFIGTFGQWHGVEVLAQAIRQMVLGRRDTLEALRLRFLLVGDGQKMPVVRTALQVADVDRYVRLTGLVPQHDAPRFLAASDLLLSPHVGNADGSRFFGSPTKLFEYMAMGRGIVASNLNQLGDVLQPAVMLAPGSTAVTRAVDGSVAVLVPPGDVDCLIRGMELLAGDETLRETLGQNARQLALSRYTWGHHVAAILAGMKRLGLGPDEPEALRAAGY
jgi:glycosyltransferase involved in cell wall biosynthesis